MRILILSCNTGEGHNSCAKALQQHFSELDISCEIINALDYVSPLLAEIICKGHIFSYCKMPKVYGAGYQYEEEHPKKVHQLFKSQINKGAEKLYQAFENKKIDAVICVHLFGAMMMSEIRKRYKVTVKTFFVATDYTCSPGVADNDADLYFIPHSRLKPEFISQEIEENKLVASGIPVRKQFYSRTEQLTARRQLELTEGKKMILLVCGSMGCGPMYQLAARLKKDMDQQTALVVICGSNKSLMKKIQILSEPERVYAVGFTDRLDQYMDAADIIVTKAGGLSATEAAVKCLPIVFINAVPGCESKNLIFFVGNKLAATAADVDGLAKTACALLDDAQARKEMVCNLQREIKANAAQTIAHYVCGAVKA